MFCIVLFLFSMFFTVANSISALVVMVCFSSVEKELSFCGLTQQSPCFSFFFRSINFCRAKLGCQGKIHIRGTPWMEDRGPQESRPKCFIFLTDELLTENKNKNISLSPFLRKFSFQTQGSPPLNFPEEFLPHQFLEVLPPPRIFPVILQEHLPRTGQIKKENRK